MIHNVLLAYVSILQCQPRDKHITAKLNNVQVITDIFVCRVIITQLI